ncbi:MAG: sensor histidine kinase [Eubacteriales bacterium]
MRSLRRFQPSLKSMTKEAFDNLPSGICFFNKNGAITLCNRQMYRLVFELTGRDLQSVDELRELMRGTPLHAARDGTIFVMDSGDIWQFNERTVTDKYQNVYTEITASEVSELYRHKKDLEQKNRQLEEVGERLRRLSANAASIIREEEILNMKMRIHDDIGRSVISARKLLTQYRPTSELDLTAWKNAVNLLRHDSENGDDRDALTQLQDAANAIGLKIIVDGNLPQNKASAYHLITAMRECATNAVRHAKSTELYVKLEKNGSFFSAVIKNNGDVPKWEISEGGGLSTLRSRIEKAGGSMTIQSFPYFELTVTVLEKTEEWQ